MLEWKLDGGERRGGGQKRVSGSDDMGSQRGWIISGGDPHWLPLIVSLK